MKTYQREGSHSWHVTPNGDKKKCSASQRKCPYGRIHFFNRDEADEYIPYAMGNVVYRSMPSRIFNLRVGDLGVNEATAPFSRYGNLGRDDVEDKDIASASLNNLRDLSYEGIGDIDKGAVSNYTGTIWVPLPGNQELEINRDTYYLKGAPGDMGVRYSVRRFYDDKYDSFVGDVDSRVEYEQLITSIETSFIRAYERDQENNDPMPFNYAEEAKKVITAINSIECASRGAERSTLDLGVDIFQTSESGDLLLEFDYSQSPITGGDVMDALRERTERDEKTRRISIGVRSVLGDDRESGWSLVRPPKEDWMLLVNDNGEISVDLLGIRDEDVLKSKVIGIVERHRGRKEAEEQAEFIVDFWHKASVSVDSYYSTVRYNNVLKALQRDERGRPLPKEPYRSRYLNNDEVTDEEKKRRLAVAHRRATGRTAIKLANDRRAAQGKPLLELPKMEKKWWQFWA